jgi:hypothetical protein
MSFYRATVLNLGKDASGYYGTVARSLIHTLKISDITWVDNVTTYSSRIDERLPTDTVHDIINRSTAQAIIIYYTKLYRGKPDRRLVAIDFTDYPLLVDKIYHAPECVRFMAMQRYDSLLPPSSYPRLDAGFFSANAYYPSVRQLNEGKWECFTPPPYIGTIDQLFFGGTLQPHSPQRQVIPLLDAHPDVRCVLCTMHPSTVGGWNRMYGVRPYNHFEYLTIAGQHLAMLALEGSSGFCYREFDALRMAAPLIMSPWRFSHRMEPLIDGVHYFAAEYDSNVEIFTERILRRFNEIRYDQKKRHQVRLNGQQWFERNATIPHITAKIVEWIESAFANTRPLV